MAAARWPPRSQPAKSHDLAALPVIKRALAVPQKRFDRPLLGFLSRDEMQAVLAAPNAQSWVGQRDQVLFTVPYNPGARVSEGLAVRPSPWQGAQATHRSIVATDCGVDPGVETAVR